jgi:sugar-specific transcriptional regulator TrmB
MTLEQELIKAGFNSNEAKVYLAVLELGEPMVGDIQQKTGLHKQIIYNTAKDLQNKGLLNIYEIRGRKRFRVSNPAALEEKARTRLEELEELVPKLLERAGKSQLEDEVRVYQGKKGIHQYYLEVTRKQPPGSETYILGVNSERYFEIFDKEGYAFRIMEEMRVEKKVIWKLLLFGPKEEEIRLNRGRPHVELRLLPDAIKAPNDIMIWHNRVGMLFYGEEPYVIDIMGPTVVEGFREYFNVFWKQGEKTS